MGLCPEDGVSQRKYPHPKLTSLSALTQLRSLNEKEKEAPKNQLPKMAISLSLLLSLGVYWIYRR